MLEPDGGGGFAGAALGVEALRQNYVNLKGAVDSGQVMIKPDAAANAAKACRDQRDKFAKFQITAQQMGNKVAHVNMGDCEEGHQLRDQLHTKALGPDGSGSAYSLFGQAADIMDKMASTYEAAGKMYHETDQANAQAFKGKM